MSRILMYVISIFLLIASKANAQTNLEKSVAKEIKLIENAVINYKDSLKMSINTLWVLEDSGQISNKETKFKKDSITTIYTQKIQSMVNTSEDRIITLIRERVEDIINTSENKPLTVHLGNKIKYNLKIDSTKIKRNFKYIDSEGNVKNFFTEKRTTSQFVLAVNLNTLVSDGNFQYNEFTPLRSLSWEFGYTRNTRILPTNNLLHLKYGFSFNLDKLGATNDRIFTRDQDGVYSLEKTGLNYKKNMFRNKTLVIPIHLEFDFTKNRKYPDINKIGFSTHNTFRFGIGGFVGTHLETLYKNKYTVDGTDYFTKTKSTYNVEKFIYGASAYVGYKQYSIYTKYHLNSLFKNQPVDANLFSIGIRRDFH